MIITTISEFDVRASTKEEDGISVDVTAEEVEITAEDTMNGKTYLRRTRMTHAEFDILVTGVKAYRDGCATISASSREVQEA